MSKKVLAAAFVSGLVFAVGLGVSGMTQPAKVIGFLDFFGGHWDPSLVLVMAGAIAVHMPFYRWLRARSAAPVAVAGCGVMDDGDQQITSRERGPRAPIDGRLIAGAAMFGVGWGLSGYCPGPAVVSLVSATPEILVFVGAMLAGMLGSGWLFLTAPRRGGADRSSPSALGHGQEI